MTKNRTPEELARQVAEPFVTCLITWNQFKKLFRLEDVKDIQEVCNSITDKHGRVCRNVKHLERQDPRPDWISEMTDAIVGQLAYILMIVNKYELLDELSDSFVREMTKSIKQHSTDKDLRE